MRVRTTVLLPALVLLAFGSLMLLWASGVLDLAMLKSHHDELAALVREWPTLSVTLFFMAFVLATALSLPVATMLSLLAGSLFSFEKALLLVSFASSCGATLAMLLARYVLRDLVEKKWPRLVSRTNKGLQRDGFYYLLALRLAPAPPFFVVNLLMGLTRMPAGKFFLVSQLGMLPLDVVFVNAGRALATVSQPADVMSLDIIIALLLASTLPLLLRELLGSRHDKRRGNGNITP
ncbi:MAG: TVP38/TMEM64 family protein [Gammaproteobacteria bacterium]